MSGQSRSISLFLLSTNITSSSSNKTMEAGPSTPGLSNSNLNAIQAQVQDVGSSTSAYHQLTLNSTSSSSLPADPLSALEDLLDMLLKISAASYSFISRKSSHKQINPQVPIWIQGQAKESSSEAARLKLGLLDDQGMQENIDELVADLIENSKEAERIIKNLPDGLVGGGEEGEEKHVSRIRRRGGLAQ